MSGPRVLIVGIYYAPEETGIGVYSTGIAEGLSQRGWDVTVLTGMPHYPAWRRRTVPPSAGASRVEVVRRAHYVPRTQSLTRRAAYEASWLVACLPELLSRRPPDAVLGVTPTLGAAVLSALAGARGHVPFVLMFQDLVGHGATQTRLRHGGAVARALNAAELGLARRAAAVAVVADGFRRHLLRHGIPEHRVHLVRNPLWMPRPTRARADVRHRLGWADDEFVVLHSGNMGLKQGLENVVRAARLAGRGDRVRFVLQGDGSQRPLLEDLARDVDSISFLPLAPHDEFPNVLRGADLLLVNQRREVSDMALPSKLTCYFGAGLPVVAAVAEGSEAGREVAASGGGVVVEPDCPEALLRAVHDLRADPGRRHDLGAAGQAYAARELQPDVTVRGMDEILRGALAAPAHRVGVDTGGVTR